ncbi:hypothetical protein FRC02_006037 [Tulasnella sp. 418]|nr:hypothetical protein FRC02_006037 [Tulasnella sp. 418]
MITPDPSQRDEASHEDDMVSQGMNGEEEEEDQLVEENPWPSQDRVADHTEGFATHVSELGLWKEKLLTHKLANGCHRHTDATSCPISTFEGSNKQFWEISQTQPPQIQASPAEAFPVKFCQFRSRRFWIYRRGKES